MTDIFKDAIASIDRKIKEAIDQRASPAYIASLRKEAGRLSLARAKANGSLKLTIDRMIREVK